jgi:hypothetical protein
MYKPLAILSLILFQACSTVSRYHSKVERNNIPVVEYSCALKNQVIKDSIIEINAQNLNECYNDDNKLLWIRYWVPYCGENSEELAILEKYSDQVDLIWIAILWDYKTINQQIELGNYPIYYIDRKLPKHRSKAATAFTNQLIENPKELVAANVFIKNGKLLHECYSQGLSDSLFIELLAN